MTNATDSIENSMNELINGINTRLSLASKKTFGAPAQSRTAAGEEHESYGVWFSLFFSKTTQKTRKGATGYKDTTYGVSLVWIQKLMMI